MRPARTAVSLLALLVLLACTPAAPPPATAPSSATAPAMAVEDGTLFTGGIVVAGPRQEPHEGLAVFVRGGVIREVGPAAELRRSHPGARVVDASGATILPGLVDAHAHLYGLGLSLRSADLMGSKSYEEVIRRMKERAAALPADAWLVGRGWDQNEWPVKEFPTADALDAALPGRHAVLRRVDGHALLASTPAMRSAGITAATPDPAGGRILRDAAGNPTGVFIDNAMSLVERVVPQPGRDERKALVLAAAQKIASEGLTGVHDCGISGETIATVKELVAEGRFPVRVYALLDHSPALLESWFASGPLVDHGGRLTIRAVKAYGDGALGSRGALLIEPYDDEPSNRGLLVTPPAKVLDLARRALAAGFQVGTHAIGDQAVRNAIDVYVEAGASPKDRFRIEHLQLISPSDVPRLAKHGIIASMQPTHATSDMDWAERRVGHERIRGGYAWRTVLNAGGRLALGSDFPVERVNPFLGIHAAVTRTDVDGEPAGGWYPEERLTLAEALRGFTLDAAYAAFEESSRGTIEPGRSADFTIVEGDFFATPAGRLHATKVRYTVVGGEVVWAAK